MGLHGLPLRQDLVRGLRWGALVAIAAALAIVGDRLWIGNRAVAREPEPVKAVAPVSKQPVPAAMVEVAAPADEAAPELKEEPAPRSGHAALRSKPRAKPKALKFVAPSAPQAAMPARQASAQPAVAESVAELDASHMPEVPIASTASGSVTPVLLPTTPPLEAPSIGDRALGVARSVGRFLRLGRNRDAQGAPAEGK